MRMYFNIVAGYFRAEGTNWTACMSKLRFSLWKYSLMNFPAHLDLIPCSLSFFGHIFNHRALFGNNLSGVPWYLPFVTESFWVLVVVFSVRALRLTFRIFTEHQTVVPSENVIERLSICVSGLDGVFADCDSAPFCGCGSLWKTNFALVFLSVPDVFVADLANLFPFNPYPANVENRVSS